jgi:hypothetical protein
MKISFASQKRGHFYLAEKRRFLFGVDNVSWADSKAEAANSTTWLRGGEIVALDSGCLLC